VCVCVCVCVCKNRFPDNLVFAGPPIIDGKSPFKAPVLKSEVVE
jgi:hypothetical protein